MNVNEVGGPRNVVVFLFYFSLDAISVLQVGGGRDTVPVQAGPIADSDSDVLHFMNTLITGRRSLPTKKTLRQ